MDFVAQVHDPMMEISSQTCIQNGSCVDFVILVILV